MKFRILFFVLVGLISAKLLLVSCAKEKTAAPVIINQIVLTAECPDTIFYSTSIALAQLTKTTLQMVQPNSN